MAWSRITDDHTSSADSSFPITPPPETAAESPRKLSPSKFKGVVPQPNGRWGAQIYENHHRIWLGTFTREESAASAYDAAAIRFRGRDAAANFIRAVDEFEFRFLNSHSKSEIVDMLRKHTYADELDRNHTLLWRPIPASVAAAAGTSIEHLFEKSVTPSDVGKLNRLVIPKQFAERHFPLKIGDSSAAAAIKGVLMSFEDRNGKVWRFRYTYWSSSQSYVLTKGWSGFVREKNLVAGDCVIFQRSAGLEKERFYIDWKSRDGNNPFVRLFGVDISVHSCGGKRVIGEDEGLGFQSGKRLRLVGL